MDKVSIIGTAGRDKNILMTRDHWLWMVDYAKAKIKKGSYLVSGGAAWADHVAVQLFLDGHASALDLHLPAPINDKGWFDGLDYKSSGSTANFYHSKFSLHLGHHSINDIITASKMDNCFGTVQPVSNNYSGLFTRNALVAKSDYLLAFTFGQGDIPDDGGTKDTWNKSKGIKHHASIPHIL